MAPSCRTAAPIMLTGRERSSALSKVPLLRCDVQCMQVLHSAAKCVSDVWVSACFDVREAAPVAASVQDQNA